MTKHERVRAALAGERVDSPPCGFWSHFAPHQASGKPAADAHVAFYRQTDVDLLKVMNEHFYRSGLTVTRASDWAKYRPMTRKDPLFASQVDLVKRLADTLADEVPLLATIHGAFISTFHGSHLDYTTFRNYDVRKHNLLTEHLRDCPEAVQPALRAVAESLTELAIACLEAGATGIYYAAQGGEEHRLPRDVFSHYLKPHDVRVLSEVADHTDCLIIHICKEYIRLPLYADYPGHAFNWDTHHSDYAIDAGREIFKRTILGGLDNTDPRLVTGTPDEVAALARDSLRPWWQKPLIFGADCSLPSTMPLDNVRALVEAARTMPTV